MGMSATQARFLELTKRRGDIEYLAQRIDFERSQLANQSADASAKYNEKMSNRKMIFSFKDGNDANSARDVDVTYNNYKSFMNQQLENISTPAKKLFLVSSSGNKIIVKNEEDMQKIIDNNKTTYSGNKEQINQAKELYEKTEDKSTLSPETIALSQIEITEENDNDYYSIDINQFKTSDFMIVEDLDDADKFQEAIKEGIYYFATYNEDADGGAKFKTESWDTLQAGAITEVYDTSDDASAQAEFDSTMMEIHSKDKKYELELTKLESEREAITTELESLEKMIDDDIDKSYKAFG